MSNESPIKLYSFTIDCLDPTQEAEFYSKLLKWQVVFQDEDWAIVAPPGVEQGAYPGLTFQRNSDYQVPVFPADGKSQQTMAHLDFAVAQLEEAVRQALEYGASLAKEQFSDSWRVLLDPAGQPFCLCQLPDIFHSAVSSSH